MLELVIIAVLASLCFALGLPTGQRLGGSVLLGMTMGMILAACLGLQALVSLYRGLDNLGAAILFYFYCLPSILGFVSGAIAGRYRSRGQG